jgi:hypothetical protein
MCLLTGHFITSRSDEDAKWGDTLNDTIQPFRLRDIGESTNIYREKNGSYSLKFIDVYKKDIY